MIKILNDAPRSFLLGTYLFVYVINCMIQEYGKKRNITW